jgi:acetyl esterase/lipase
MASYVCWATLAAASGIVGITYENREPAADARAVLDDVRRNAVSLGVDDQRLAIWSCSGNVPTALSVLMDDGALACAVLCYGYMLDLDGSTAVADAAKQFRFANPAAGKSIDDLPANLPLFVARAGRDESVGLNEALDRFVAAALKRNLPITIVNHPHGPHAFDLVDDGEASRRIIRQILRFMREHLASNDL